MFKIALFAVLLIPLSAKADVNKKTCMYNFTLLCDETLLSTEELEQQNKQRSAAMLKICRISVVLCNKDVLLPSDLEKID